jgi:hypothetical protein
MEPPLPGFRLMTVKTKDVNLKWRGRYFMKKALSLIIILCVVVSILTVPADAKSDSKTKTITMYLEGEIRGVQVNCEVPYYSKWKVPKETVTGRSMEFTTSKDETVTVAVLDAEDEDDAKLLCKYLTKKKYKKQLFAYLCDGFSINIKDADKYFKLKKDGNGKYMIIIDLDDQYGVLRAIDGSNVFMYFTETDKGSVSASLKKKLISYTKQVTIETKAVGVNGSDLGSINEGEQLNIELDPQKVIFEDVYTNMAWGYQKQATYILGDGRVYTYNYSKNPEKLEDLSEESVIEYLKGTEPACVMSKTYLMKLYSYAEQINPDAAYTTQHEMYDYGQRTLYFYAEDGTKVKCSCYGDVRYIYDDDYAKKVEELWDEWYRYCEDA